MPTSRQKEPGSSRSTAVLDLDRHAGAEGGVRLRSPQMTEVEVRKAVQSINQSQARRWISSRAHVIISVSTYTIIRDAGASPLRTTLLSSSRSNHRTSILWISVLAFSHSSKLRFDHSTWALAKLSCNQVSILVSILQAFWKLTMYILKSSSFCPWNLLKSCRTPELASWTSFCATSKACPS